MNWCMVAFIALGVETLVLAGFAFAWWERSKLSDDWQHLAHEIMETAKAATAEAERLKALQ